MCILSIFVCRLINISGAKIQQSHEMPKKNSEKCFEIKTF